MPQRCSFSTLSRGFKKGSPKTASSKLGLSRPGLVPGRQNAARRTYSNLTSPLSERIAIFTGQNRKPSTPMTMKLGRLGTITMSLKLFQPLEPFHLPLLLLVLHGTPRPLSYFPFCGVHRERYTNQVSPPPWLRCYFFWTGMLLCWNV